MADKILTRERKDPFPLSFFVTPFLGRGFFGVFLIGSDLISGLCNSSVIAIEWNGFGRRQMCWQITGATRAETGAKAKFAAAASRKEMGTLPDW